MKIYLASSFKLIDKVKEAAQRLEQYGHTITVKWWERAFQIPGEISPVKTTDLKKRYENMPPEDFYSRPETYWSFVSDFQGVKDADIFVFIAGSEPRKFNGANVELGIALGDLKPCFVIGELETSVLYYRVIRCSDVDELMRVLELPREYV